MSILKKYLWISSLIAGSTLLATETKFELNNPDANGVAETFEMIKSPVLSIKFAIENQAQSIEVTSSTGKEQGGVATRYFTFEANKKYKISLDFKTSGKIAAYSALTWYNENEKKYENKMICGFLKSNDWKTQTIEFSSTYTFRGNIQLRAANKEAGDTGFVWYRNVTINDEEPNPGAAVSGLNQALSENTAQKTIFEPDFSQETTNGRLENFSTVNNPQIETQYSLENGVQKIDIISSKIAEQVGVSSYGISFEKGVDYRIELEYRTKGSNIKAFAMLAWHDEARKKYDSFPIVNFRPSSEWTKVKVLLTPDTSFRATLELRAVVHLAGATGSVEYRKVKISELTKRPAKVEISAIPVPPFLPAPEQMAPRGKKKIIKMGWDLPSPRYIAQNLDMMEKRPLDGIATRFEDYNHCFDVKSYPEDLMRKQVEDFAKIKSGSLTDNFIEVYAANLQKMDWFNDEQWTVILKNAALTARLMKQSNFTGLLFDTEPYGNSPWSLREVAPDRRFPEVAAKVYERGMQYMAAMQKEFANIKIILPWAWSYIEYYNPELLDESDSTRTQRKLSGDAYGLLLYFINGMLAAADKEVVLIDGAEGGYYYTSAQEYQDRYHRLRVDVLKHLVPAELHKKYQMMVQTGSALWPEWAMKPNPGYKLGSYILPSDYLNMEEQAQLLEWKTFMMLDNADEYAFSWNSNINWWDNSFPNSKLIPMPQAMQDAIARGRAKAQNKQRINIDGDALFAKVTEGKNKANKEKIQALDICAADIKYGDKYENATTLRAFIKLHSAENNITAQTKLSAFWNERGLFLKIECDEPIMDKLVCIGKLHDDDVWRGDSVDIFIAKPGDLDIYYHLIVNPDNVVMDEGPTPAGVSAKWNGLWQSSVNKYSNRWVVEISLPWSSINYEPKETDILKFNVARSRKPVNEYSSWSQCISGFKEPATFGTIKLVK